MPLFSQATLSLLPSLVLNLKLPVAQPPQLIGSAIKAGIVGLLAPPHARTHRAQSQLNNNNNDNHEFVPNLQTKQSRLISWDENLPAVSKLLSMYDLRLFKKSDTRTEIRTPHKKHKRIELHITLSQFIHMIAKSSSTVNHN